MLKLLVCVVALNVPATEWPEQESCFILEVSDRPEIACAWFSAATLAKGRGRVSFCRPFDGRTKP